MDIQRQVYQRQILAMMGVTPWVSRDAARLPIEFASRQTDLGSAAGMDAAVTEPQLLKHPKQLIAAEASNDAVDLDVIQPASESVIGGAHPDIAADDSKALATQPEVENREHAIKGPNRTLNLTTKASSSQAPVSVGEGDGVTDNPLAYKDANDNSEQQIAVAPFTLQGVSYNNWVLLVDLANLNERSQILWQNLQQGLSLLPDQLSFPFCETMSTLDMANASLAGFVFKLGNSERVQVSALTELPEGLDHERMLRTPLLDEMIAEPKLKRQLWQLISQSQ